MKTNWVEKLKTLIEAVDTVVDTLEGLVGTIDSTVTSDLHGKLGTDAELADHSLYDLLGGLAFKTHALSAMLGALTTTDNLKGILGGYTTAANLKAAIDTINGYVDLIDDVTNGLAAIKAEVEGLAGAAMRGTDDAALATDLGSKGVGDDAIARVQAVLDDLANVTDGLGALKTAIEAVPGTNGAALHTNLGAIDTAAATGAISDAKAAMAYLKQLVTQGVTMMTFSSPASSIIVIPATGADLVFPSVEVSGLPTGANLLRVDMALVIGGLFDTSASENQIKIGTTDQLFVMKSGASWGSDDIKCLDFTALSLQVDKNAYRGGCVLFGATDIKGEVDGNATYEFQSRETHRTKGVESTGGGLELLDVTTVVRVWFN